MEEVNVLYEMFSNATYMMSGSDTITNLLFPLLVVGIGAGVLALLFFVSGNISKYRKVKRIFHFLYKCFSYSAYGMLTVSVVAIPCFLGWNVLQYAGDNPDGLLEFLKWVGIGVGALVGFGLVGYVTKNRIWKRIFKFHRIEKEKKDGESGMITIKNSNDMGCIRLPTPIRCDVLESGTKVYYYSSTFHYLLMRKEKQDNLMV